MTVALLQKLSFFSFVGAILFLLAGVVLFFLFDIPEIYGNIPERKIKKARNSVHGNNKTTLLKRKEEPEKQEGFLLVTELSFTDSEEWIE